MATAPQMQGTAAGAATAKPPVEKVKKEPIVKDPKLPREGKMGDDATIEPGRAVKDGEKLHKQQSVILESMQATLKNGKTTRNAITAHIQGNKELIARMNTVQPIPKCVVYHEKILAKNGLLKSTKIEVPKPEKVDANAAGTKKEPVKA